MKKQLMLFMVNNILNNNKTVLETAYKTLQDPDKRKVFQGILREAKERVELERSKENKLRAKRGKLNLFF